MRIWLVGLIVLLCTPAFSQQPPAIVSVDDLHYAGTKSGALHADAWPGRIYKLTLDGQILGVLGESGKQLKQFSWVHEVACPSENVLWVGELLNWRAQKLVLHP